MVTLGPKMPRSEDEGRVRAARLRLVGPEGDPEAQALWLPLRRAYATAHQLASLGATFGLQDSHTFSLQLADAGKDTPATDACCLESRDAFIEAAVERASAGQTFVRSITIGGEQHDGPIMKAAIEQYRRYAFGRITVDLDRARGLIGIMIRLVEASAPENFRYAQSSRGAAPAALAMMQEVRHQLHEEVLACREPFLAYAKKLKRMQALERLGRKF